MGKMRFHLTGLLGALAKASIYFRLNLVKIKVLWSLIQWFRTSGKRNSSPKNVELLKDHLPSDHLRCG